MTDLPDWTLIDRYLAGDATVTERAVVQAWVDAQPNRHAAIAWLRTQQSPGEPAWNADAAWTTLRTRIATNGAAVTPLRRRSSPVWRVAAVLIVAAGLGTGWLATRRPASVALVPVREIFTLNGQRTTVTLDDGTRVSLNAASRLRYDASYGKTTRDVYLDGEGYFDVKHDAKRPFRVHARGGVAEDLGTRFTMVAYSDQPTIEVAVTEGVVALRRYPASESQAIRLEAGEVGQLPDSGAPTKVRLASLDRYIGWTGGTLVLDSVPLQQAATAIERWYGVKIIIADSALAKRPVVARFQRESVQQAIDALAFALGARSERRESTYTLAPARQ